MEIRFVIPFNSSLLEQIVCCIFYALDERLCIRDRTRHDVLVVRSRFLVSGFARTQKASNDVSIVALELNFLFWRIYSAIQEKPVEFEIF